jgi:hypothetical protein
MEALKASVKGGKSSGEKKTVKAERPAKKQLKRKVG